MSGKVPSGSIDHAPGPQDDTSDAITPARPGQTPPARVLGNVDKAAEFLASHGTTAFSYKEERQVLRQIDRRILPLLLGAYFFQQLDKSALSYVSIFGIIEDANLVGDQYSWLSSILYFAQLVFQPLAAFLLVKYPTGKVIGIAVLCWGGCAALMATFADTGRPYQCTNFASLLALRFLLGSFEAMIAPSCLAVTQMWWRRSEQTLRTSYWTAMNGVTFIVGSLVTYGLGHIHSDGIFRYQIIFIFCGMATVVFGIVFLCFMPDSPMEATFMDEKSQMIAVERLRANQMGVASRDWKWYHVKETFTDFKTYLWFIFVTAISIASGGIGAFGNLIVRDFGYTNFTAILFSLPSGFIQVFAILASAWVATKTGRKGVVITGLACFPTTGALLMLLVPRNDSNKGVLLFGYYLVQSLVAITPMIFAWSAQNTGGDTKRKSSSAVMFMGMCTGNIIGPLLYNVKDAPTYRPGLISSLVIFVLVGILGLLIPLYLMALNKWHAKKREQLGKRADVVDESMMRKEARQESKQVEFEEAQDEARAVEDDNGFQDQPDLRNEDFVYVY